jgi:hypothetical protein
MTTCPTCGAHQVQRDWLYVEKPNVRHIIAVVASRHGLTVEHILGQQTATWWQREHPAYAEHRLRRWRCSVGETA